MILLHSPALYLVFSLLVPEGRAGNFRAVNPSVSFLNNNNNNNNNNNSHHLGLDRPVSASSIGTFEGLPSRLGPFGLEFSIIFGFLLLFILVTCRSQFYLHLLSFSSSGSTF